MATESGDAEAKDAEHLVRLCGGEEMADRVKKLWEDLTEKNRLDVSKQHLSDTEIGLMLKGLYSMARTTGFQTERMKPFPITELDFSGNELTAKGIDEVVQFARTAGANATLVDLSDNRLDDEASTELARLVKNYNSFASQKLLAELLLNGNEIGKAGATKLIQYAHWERDRYKNEAEPPAAMKLDLSDNCIDRPNELIDELKTKRIRCSADPPEGDVTVHLPDFADQRAAKEDKEPERGSFRGSAYGSTARGGGGGDGARGGGGGARGGGGGSGICWDYQKGRCNRGPGCRFKHEAERGGGYGDRGRDRRDDYDRRDRDRDRDRRDDRDRDRGGDRERDRDRRDDRDRGGDRDRDRDRRDDRDDDRGGDRDRDRDRRDDRDDDRDRRRDDRDDDRDRRRDRRRDDKDDDDEED